MRKLRRRTPKDDDQFEGLIKDTHETVGRLKALIENLADNIDAIEAEIEPREEKGEA